MRAIVLSDSHNNTDACEKAINSVDKIDMIIHLGDIAKDVEYLEALYHPIKVVSVLGNNDFMHSGNHERVVEFDGHKLFLCHGHTLGVGYSTARLEGKARENGCSAALYGHTHTSSLKKCDDGLLILNPGSVSIPKDGSHSCMVYENGCFHHCVLEE